MCRFDTVSQQVFKTHLSLLERWKRVQLWHFLYEPFFRFTTGWTKMHLTFVLLSKVQPYLTARNCIVCTRGAPYFPNVMFFFYHGATAPVGQGLLLVEDSRSHSDTPHLVRLLWTSDQPDAEPSTWQRKTLTKDSNLCPGGIRTHNPSKRATADPQLRPRGHWERWTVMLGHTQTFQAWELVHLLRQLS
jgi:hypothetical protein